jgi:hypothetical protein
MIGAGVDVAPYWLATEYVAGPTLAQAVARFGALPPQICHHLLTALARAMRDIHSQGVQHRDLKPQNVILGADGPRLIDFGIARGEDQTAITRTGQAAGTPGYLAPEVVTRHQMSPAADIFALGGVMAYAATGRPPFGSGEAHAVIYRSITDEIDLTGVDPGLARLVRSCTAKDPVMRPTPDQLLSQIGVAGPPAHDVGYQALLGLSQPPPPDLASAIAGGLVSAHQGTLADGNGAGFTLQGVPATPGRRPRRTLIAFAGSTVVIVAVAITVLVSQLSSPPPARGKAGASGSTGTAPTSGAPNASGTSGTLGAAGTSGASGTRNATAAPTEVLRNRTGLETGALVWDPASATCKPSTPYEENPRDDIQISAPRQGVRAGASVELSFRFKYDAPAGYYVAAEVREPPAFRGNAEVSMLTRPVHVQGAQWSDLTYPKDFTGSFPIPADDGAKGGWTVIWYHVHSDGQAYFVMCDGFKVT